MSVRNIIGLIVILLIVAGGIWYLTRPDPVSAPTYDYSSVTTPTPLPLPVQAPVSETNPFDADANPFEAGYTNPFE